MNFYVFLMYVSHMYDISILGFPVPIQYCLNHKLYDDLAKRDGHTYKLFLVNLK